MPVAPFTRQTVPDPRVRFTLQCIQRHLKPAHRVVEIGSDEATFKGYFDHDAWETVDKYGNPDHVADLDGPGARLPMPDASVDVVICTEVLEHLRSGTFLVKEISRVLKPQGCAVISVPNINSLKSRVRFLFGQVPHLAASGDCGHELGGTGVLVDGAWVAGHVVDFNAKRFVSYLARGGLRVIERVRLPIPLTSRYPTWEVPSAVVPPNLAEFLLFVAGPQPR